MVGGRCGIRGRKMADHVFTHTQEAVRENRKQGTFINPMAWSQWFTSCSKIPKGPTTFPNSGTNWGPGIQILEPMGEHFLLELQQMVSLPLTYVTCLINTYKTFPQIRNTDTGLLPTLRQPHPNLSLGGVRFPFLNNLLLTPCVSTELRPSRRQEWRTHHTKISWYEAWEMDY